MVSAGDELAGRYRLQELIGRGAMGEVWLAEDQMLHRTVAVKQLLAERATGDDPTHAERVMREARIAGRLSHPNAVAVHDLVVSDGVPLVVMEYVNGQSLGARIRERGPLPPAEAARLIADVAGALAAAHAAGIVHRDVKPDNVLIAEDGTVKLVDFGIAKAAEDAGLTQTGMTIGTPSYIAPEVARGGVPSPASDIWSLGATLYTAVEGQPPFGGANEGALAVLSRVIGDPIPSPRRAGPLTPTIMRMLDRDPTRRPSATSVRTLLTASAAGSVVAGMDSATMVGVSPAAQTTVSVPGRGSTQPIPVLPPPIGPPAAMPRPLGYRQPSDQPPQRRRSNDALLATLAVIALLVAGAGIVIALLVRNSGNGSPATTPPTTPTTPTISTPVTTPATTHTVTTTAPPTTEPTTPTTTPTTPTTPSTTPTTPTTPSTTPTTPTTLSASLSISTPVASGLGLDLPPGL